MNNEYNNSGSYSQTINTTQVIIWLLQNSCLPVLTVRDYKGAFDGIIEGVKSRSFSLITVPISI